MSTPRDPFAENGERLPLPNLDDLPGKNATLALTVDAAKRIADVDADHLDIGDRLSLNVAYGVLRAMARKHGRG